MDVFISKRMKHFIVLAHAKSITKAADVLHMTPSPLGRSIAILEEQIGHELFTRKDKQLTLNKVGQELYQELFPIYQRLSTVDNEIISSSARKIKKIVIGIDETYPTLIFDQLISLGDKFKGLVTQSFKFSDENVINNLLGGHVNFIISPQQASQRLSHLREVNTYSMNPLRLGFIVSHYHRDKPIEELLASIPWLQMRFQNQANFEALLEFYAKELNIQPTIIYRHYSFLAKIGAVQTGKFITVAPYFSYKLLNPEHFIYFDSPGKCIQLNEYIYSLNGNSYIEKLIQHIQQDRELFGV